MTRDDMIDILRNNVVEIMFTKVDGSERIMKCSLNESFLPMVINSTKNKRKENMDNISVYDISLNEWRSFRVNSVTKFSVLT